VAGACQLAGGGDRHRLRHRLRDVVLGGKGRRSARCRRRHRRVVDLTFDGVDQQDEIRIASAQLVLDQAARPVPLGARVLEPAVGPVAKDADAVVLSGGLVECGADVAGDTPDDVAEQPVR
jgi:hypothetical protein